MRQTFLFSKTRKEVPTDEVAKNAQLLIRAGYVHKEMAGVYSLLPLGLRVEDKITNLIRHEMIALGALEVRMSSLQDPAPWEASGRWNDKAVDSWFKTKVRTGGDVGLGFTHEEPLTRLLSHHVHSHKDLPFSVFQIQTKFRNEARAKSGLVRGREFPMKDLYSFSRTTAEHDDFYTRAQAAYVKIFNDVGLGGHTYLTYAAGGSFSTYSHEFQTVSDAGEDTIHICTKCHVAVNDEILPDVKGCPKCGSKKLVSSRAIEVGNIFSLGTRFSEALALQFVNETGVKHPVVMGSYGIGVSRVMGTVVEVLSDNEGIVWPEVIAPYRVHLICIGDGKKETHASNALYEKLMKLGIEVLYDDRDESAGRKLTESDLIGIPLRIIVSSRTLEKDSVELRARTESESRMMSEEDAVRKCVRHDKEQK